MTVISISGEMFPLKSPDGIDLKKSIFFDQMIIHYDIYGAIMFRKHLHTYSKAGYQGASAFRDHVNRVEDPNEMREIITEFFSQDYIGQNHQ